MRTITLAVALVSLALLAPGCNKTNPNFCEGDQCAAVDAPLDSPPVTCSGTGPDPSCPAANPVCVAGECTGSCTSDTDCAGRPAAERVCLTSTGACVGCDEVDEQVDPPMSAEDECPAPMMAVCDGGSHTCRPCEAHGECVSGVCDAGRCAPDAEVVYVAPTGSDGGNCGARATPCLTLNEAIDKVQATAALDYILLLPSATPYAARSNTDRADFDAVDVLVVGYGAIVNRNGTGPVLDVRGGSNVRIEGLEVSNATGVGTGSGIVVADSSLSLFEAKVQNNAYRGVNVTSNSTLTILRSRIMSNVGGGIFLGEGKATIVNNVVAGNGHLLSSQFGGMSLNLTQTPNVIEFNTVVSNAAPAGTADGIACVPSTVVARNNIVIGAPTSPRVSGTCVHTFSLFTPADAPPGNGNMLVADQSMYMFTPDFHINDGSVAEAKAEGAGLSGESLVDIDGDERTLGGTTVDVGADEIP